MICLDGPFGPGFAYFLDENSSRYLCFFSCAWNFNRVEGRTMTAVRCIWRGLRKSDQNAKLNRSNTVKFGARRRERLMISSCCFISRLSATIAFAPPGPSNLAMVTTRCANSKDFLSLIDRISNDVTKIKTVQIHDLWR